MIVYIFLILSILIIGCSANLKIERKRKNFLFFAGTLIILIIGLRNIYLGPADTYRYFMSFEYAQNATYQALLNYSIKDPFYFIFIKFIGPFVFYDFTCYLLLIAFFYIWAFFRFFYKKSPDVFLSILMFLTLGFFSVSMFLIRQIISISIIVFSYEYLQEKKCIKFIFCVVIASLFHASALIFLVAYPLSYVRINKLVICLYIGASFIVFLYGHYLLNISGVFLIDDRFAGYADSERTLSLAGYLQIVILLLFSLLNKNSIEKKYSYYNVDVLFHLSFLALVFQSGASVIAEIFRIALYFKIFLLILVPLAVCSINGKRNVIYSSSLNIILVLYYIFTMYQKDYAFFWENYLPKY